MKLIFVFALIAAVSCDVSHIVQGDGWYKDETGYHYTQPAAKFDEVVVEEVIVADEPAPVEVAEPEQQVYDAPVEVEVAAPVETPVEEAVVADEPAPVEVAEPVVVEILADPVPAVADAPANNLREYLPPFASADAKKKRQIPVRRVIRKVQRGFLPPKNKRDIPIRQVQRGFLPPKNKRDIPIRQVQRGVIRSVTRGFVPPKKQ